MKTIIITLTILNFLWHSGHACTCIGSTSVKAEIKNSDLVIVGKILSTNLVYPLKGRPEFQGGKAHFKVLIMSKYKGQVTSDTITIVTGIGGGDCGFVFETGKQYIIYGRRDLQQGYGETKRYRNTFETDICTRTQILDKTELAEIQKYRKANNRKSNSY